MQKVSADTVTKLTSIFAPPSAASEGPAPTAQEMIDKLRHRFRNTPDRLKKLNDIVNNVPAGFRLEPVLYSRITKPQNNSTDNQFDGVRPEFFKYLAANHADELEALGICPLGIKKMADGLNPRNHSGRAYDVNVDHIIERFGGGRISTTKRVDHLMPAGSAETYLVNHFNNLILMPLPVHEMKNKLNGLQFYFDDGKEKNHQKQNEWILMMVPERGPGYSGYIAHTKQAQLASSESPRKREDAPLPASASVQHENPLQIVVGSVHQANATINNRARQQQVKPALDEVSRTLREAFNQASKPHQDMPGFRDFYRGKNISRLRAKLDTLPVNDTKALKEALRVIDHGLAMRFPKENKQKKKANSGSKKSHVPRRLRGQRRG